MMPVVVAVSTLSMMPVMARATVASVAVTIAAPFVLAVAMTVSAPITVPVVDLHQIRAQISGTACQGHGGDIATCHAERGHEQKRKKERSDVHDPITPADIDG